MSNNSSIQRLSKVFIINDLIKEQNAKKHQWINNRFSDVKESFIIFLWGVSALLFWMTVFVD